MWAAAVLSGALLRASCFVCCGLAEYTVSVAAVAKGLVRVVHAARRGGMSAETREPAKRGARGCESGLLTRLTRNGAPKT